MGVPYIYSTQYLFLSVSTPDKSISSRFTYINADSMTNITLQFPDLTQLAKFRFLLKESFLEMNVRHLTISCECSAAMVKEAVINYGATVLLIQKEQEAQ